MADSPITEPVPGGFVQRLKAWPKPILRADGTPKRAPAPETETIEDKPEKPAGRGRGGRATTPPVVPAPESTTPASEE